MPMPPTLFSAALPPYKPCCHSHRSFSSLGKPCLGNHASWRRLGNRGQCAQYEQILTAAPSAATAQPETFDAWYRNKDFESPQRYIGPIKTHLFPDKGRGVIATRDVRPGELLLVCGPLAVLHAKSSRDGRHSADELIDSILASPETQANRWMDVLYNGTSKACKKLPGWDGEVVETAAAAPAAAPAAMANSAPAAAAEGQQPSKGFSGGGVAAKKAAAGKAGGGAEGRGNSNSNNNNSGGGGSVLEKLAGRSAARRVADVVRYNCYGDEHMDLAAAALRGVEPVGHIGVWPEFSLLNHSCSPNTIHWVLGDTMVVRCATPIKSGDEVTISYLGRPQLAPVAQRVAALKEEYGFDCDCPRCQSEALHDDKVGSQVEELVKLATEELRVPFGTALKEGDIKELAFIKGQVAPAVLSLFAAFRKTLLSPKPRLYFSASSFEALELWADCCVALGEDASQPLGAAVKAVEAVSPGSDLHAILAARQQDLAARTHGADSTQAAAARQAAVRAHVLRYGATSESVTEQLVKANLTLYS